MYKKVYSRKLLLNSSQDLKQHVHVQVINLRRPGLAAVQKIMRWTPLHLAAAEGEVRLMECLIKDHDCDILACSVNSWTPLHYAAAHNNVSLPLGAHSVYASSA